MGLRYVGFRIKHELLRRSGLLKSSFPTAPAYRQYATLEEWKSQSTQFFFNDRSDIRLPRNAAQELADRFGEIEEGKILMFSSVLTDLGKDYDWITNPDSGHKYDSSKHWTEIADYSKTAGDIKYVWEKSRFSYLYTIIRHDYHFGQDHSEMVFRDILSWIEHNPVNCGPNYRCSQEMSLRMLNWTFALHYYRQSASLTNEVFNKMQYATYWHLHHIYNNIDFSRIAVRNNHAITETLALYLGGLLYPSMPDAAVWKQKGKAWFEQEIAYQIYDDGTFLQYSMNYHRIVVQLLTWGIVLSEKNGERFSDVVYDRARKSVIFLRTCMTEERGWLPNYGANDGALFFGLGNTHYRDYRPQLQALANALGMTAGISGEFEDKSWYGISRAAADQWTPAPGTHSFDKGGYYIIRETDTLTFIKCGSYKDRPSQADNLHIDIWYKGENILIDAGSYKYNTDDATIRYFNGTRSHNTVMLAGNDQMLKGGRFIWYYWTKSATASLLSEKNSYTFTGTINAFRQIKGDIVHRRTITKQHDVAAWQVTDEIIGAPANLALQQLWHTPHSSQTLNIDAKESNGTILPPAVSDGWASSLYGQKEQTTEYCFSTTGTVITTNISLK